MKNLNKIEQNAGEVCGTNCAQFCQIYAVQSVICGLAIATLLYLDVGDWTMDFSSNYYSKSIEDENDQCKK